jgi:hypothetical protein
LLAAPTPTLDVLDGQVRRQKAQAFPKVQVRLGERARLVKAEKNHNRKQTTGLVPQYDPDSSPRSNKHRGPLGHEEPTAGMEHSVASVQQGCWLLCFEFREMQLRERG